MNYRALINPLPKLPNSGFRMHHVGAGTVLIITYLKTEIVAFLER
jgi:hypothetical protein